MMGRMRKLKREQVIFTAFRNNCIPATTRELKGQHDAVSSPGSGQCGNFVELKRNGFSPSV